jgi:hypothetical protein
VLAFDAVLAAALFGLRSHLAQFVDALVHRHDEPPRLVAGILGGTRERPKRLPNGTYQCAD